MNIEKIVLDVLEENKEVISGLAGSADCIWGGKFDNIAKSITAKIQAVSIDRDEVMKVLIEFRTEVVDQLDKGIWVDGGKYADKILSLLKPAKESEDN